MVALALSALSWNDQCAGVVDRKAQARFRERRKAEQAEKAARMAHLEAKLAALLQENAELSVRTEVWCEHTRSWQSLGHESAWRFAA